MKMSSMVKKYDVWWAGRRMPEQFSIPENLGAGLYNHSEYGVGKDAVEALEDAMRTITVKHGLKFPKKWLNALFDDAVKIAGEDPCTETDYDKMAFYFVVIYFS